MSLSKFPTFHNISIVPFVTRSHGVILDVQWPGGQVDIICQSDDEITLEEILKRAVDMHCLILKNRSFK